MKVTAQTKAIDIVNELSDDPVAMIKAIQIYGTLAHKRARHEAIDALNEVTYESREKGEQLPNVGALCKAIESRIMNLQDNCM